MILYFKNSAGIEREIGQPNTYKSTCKMIDKFLKEHKFKSYYTRIQREYDNPCCKTDKTKIRYVFDVGSHTEFFILDTKGKQIEEFTGL